MKKIFILFAALTSLKSVHAQMINGTISNSKRNFIVLQYADKYWLATNTDTIKLSKNGSFNYFSKHKSPITNGYLEISSNQNLNIWFSAKDKLGINIKDSSWPSFSAGPLARINEYLQKEDQSFERIYKSYEQKHSEFMKLASSRSDEYFRITDSVTADQILFLEQFLKGPKNRYEQMFVIQKKNSLIYQNLFYKISYQNPPLEKLAYYQKNFNTTAPTSFAYSNQISFNNSDLLDNLYFLRFSRFFFMELVFKYQKDKKLKLSKEEFYEKLFSFINQLAKDKLCNAVLKASFMNEEVNTMSLNQNVTEVTYGRFVDSLLSFPQIVKEAKFIENNFNRKVNELHALKVGTIAPSCTLNDSLGNTFFLERFKGKLLYIDVWASWCGKCIEAMPYWNKLVDKYRDNNNVVFVTVSTDEMKDREKWLRLLNKHKPKGQHFISVGGSNSEFAKKFLVNMYPTNILIDKEGRIININAERPGNIDLSAYLQ